MTSLNKFFPAGNKNITSSFLKNNTMSSLNLCRCKKPDEIPCDQDNPEKVMEMWKKMGSPSATVFMCGYKIVGGKIVG